jgi:hypothetical protein
VGFIFFGRIFCPWNPRAKNQAFRCKSSDLLMQILRAFRFNPGRMGEQRICECKFATSPLRARQRRGVRTTFSLLFRILKESVPSGARLKNLIDGFFGAPFFD